jgi:hypothetical protein
MIERACWDWLPRFVWVSRRCNEAHNSLSGVSEDTKMYY